MKRLQRWWVAQSERRQAVMRWGLPLLGVSILVALVWAYHHAQGVATRDQARDLLARVGFVCLLSAVVMLIGTRKWRIQGLGLMLQLLGEAGFYVRAVDRLGPWPLYEWERDLYQSLLDVGSVLLALGLVVWFLSRRRRKEGSGIV